MDNQDDMLEVVMDTLDQWKYFLSEKGSNIEMLVPQFPAYNY